MRLMAATYARAEDTTMSVSAPVAMNVLASMLPVCAEEVVIATSSGTLADTSGRMLTLVCARDSIPSTTAVTEYSTRSTLTRTSSSIAL